MIYEESLKFVSYYILTSIITDSCFFTEPCFSSNEVNHSLTAQSEIHAIFMYNHVCSLRLSNLVYHELHVQKLITLLLYYSYIYAREDM